MKRFSDCMTIDPVLKDFFTEVEKHFSISVDPKIIEQIFEDAENDQVSQKDYKIFDGKKRFFSAALRIFGNVEEYEPETICIEIQNVKERDVKYLQELVEDLRMKFNVRIWKLDYESEN